MESFIVDLATHTLCSAAILFQRDRGERDSVKFMLLYSHNIDYVMEANFEWGVK